MHTDPETVPIGWIRGCSFSWLYQKIHPEITNNIIHITFQFFDGSPQAEAFWFYASDMHNQAGRRERIKYVYCIWILWYEILSIIGIFPQGNIVPDETIRRRYHAGPKNFFQLYRPLADSWRIYDNSRPGEPRLISSGENDSIENVTDKPLWEALKREYHG